MDSINGGGLRLEVVPPKGDDGQAEAITRTVSRGDLFLDVRVDRAWENVDLVRESVFQCCCAVFDDGDRVHAFASTVAELLENAIKYGHWPDAHAGGTRKIRVRVYGNDSAVRVEVENPVDATAEDTSELFRTLDWLRSFPSAEEAYHAKLMDVAASPLGVSKLGLVRTAFEGECDLRAEILGDVLRVSGATRITGDPR